ncbi:unnamed protein product [Oppiella nova]|uniref:adenylate cyclase n=1 Tax=Oppiella nova TaxID=334625 RepID=A0A7R9QJY8_9ACAR|nr:unnamed protein product [Oppiella nova]CAG2167213.1 unnamed protein product [Oppiella nova]
MVAIAANIMNLSKYDSFRNATDAIINNNVNIKADLKCIIIERTSRLDFLWKLQAQKELQDMRELRHYNTQLLKNILPDHVASYFLTHDRNSEVHIISHAYPSSHELYAQSYANCVVLFASIPNFANFYSEDVNNGVECIRLLNEIIFDFDQLMDDDRFRCIEKIKTISSTYMAASGLNPRDQGKSVGFLLSAVADLALSMKEALEDVNKHSFNNFKLRIGITHGPVVGGVIGAKKPVYDIWGNTVNEASRMDSTGTIDHIQVPKASAQVLETEGFRVHYRGVVPVKGKGEMETYYLMGRKIERSKSFGRSQYAAKHSMTAVLSAMVNNRKKQTLGSSLSVPSSKLQLRPRNSPGLSSLSFNFRKTSRSPHRLNRMQSEMGGRPKRGGSTVERRTPDTGVSSHSFPDIISTGSLKERGRDRNKDQTIINI